MFQLFISNSYKEVYPCPEGTAAVQPQAEDSLASAATPLPHRRLDGEPCPETAFIKWLKPLWKSEMMNGPQPAPAVWDATKPSGRAYWMRLYPWGANFACGREVVLSDPVCAALFPGGWLSNFESKMQARDVALCCGIPVAKEAALGVDMDNAPWLARTGTFVLKPDALALSEGVLVACRVGEEWSFTAPPLAQSILWDPRFKTSQRLCALRSTVGSGARPSEVAAAWIGSFDGPSGEERKWVVQERIPGVREFDGKVSEIKVYVLGGRAWLANHTVQTERAGGSIKHPVCHIDADGAWHAVPPPSGALPGLSATAVGGLAAAVLRMVVEELAPAAERLATELGARFMMRADFFIFPHGATGPDWSLAGVKDVKLSFVFNEMQHHMGKSLFTQPDHGIDFLWPSFEATVSTLLRQSDDDYSDGETKKHSAQQQPPRGDSPCSVCLVAAEH